MTMTPTHPAGPQAPARHTAAWRIELTETVRLAVPMAATQLGQVTMMTTDLMLLGRAFGATAAEPRFLPDADFNEDEVVDGDDLAVVAANFGRER